MNKPLTVEDILSNHENLCEDQSQACGDCRRLKQDIEDLIRERERLARIDEVNYLRNIAYWENTQDNTLKYRIDELNQPIDNDTK